MKRRQLFLPLIAIVCCVITVVLLLWASRQAKPPGVCDGEVYASSLGADPQGVGEAVAPHRSSAAAAAPVSYPLAAALLSGLLLLYLQQGRKYPYRLPDQLQAARALIDASPLPIVALHPDGRVCVWNAAAERLFGWTAGEVLGRPLPSVPAAGAADFAEQLTEVGLGKVLYRQEIRRETRSGQTILVNLHAAPMRGPGGEIIGTMVILEDISERRAAEEALRASRERLSTVFESAPDGCFLCDMEGRFVDGNRAAERMIGGQRADLIGRSWRELGLLDPAERGQAVANLQRSAAGEATGPDEYTLRRLDGRHIPIEIRTFPVVLDGRPLVLGSARDLTERNQVERALRESERRFHDMLMTVRMVAIMLDRRGRITFCNGFLLELTGRLREEAIQSDWFETFIPPASRDDVRGAFAAMFSSGQCPAYREDEIVSADGRHHLIAWYNTLLRSPEGEVIGVASLGKDITERRQMELILRASRLEFQKLSREFQVVLDGIPDSLVLVGEDRRILWANQGTVRLLALADHPSGQPCNLLCQGSCSCGECPVNRCFQTGQTESGRMATPDGRIWGVKAFSLQQDGGGRQVIRWGSDITESVRVQEKALQAARLASLGELAAGVAHEINNPNGLVLFNSALVRDVLTDAIPLLDAHYEAEGEFRLGGLNYGRVREELPTLLSGTIDAARRIKHIVEDLKYFSRQELNHLESLDLNSVVNAAIRLVLPTLNASTDRFEPMLAEGLPPVAGNEQRLTQVVLNLLMNACQALPDRSKRIALLTRFDPLFRLLILTVEDEGVGIPAEILPSITAPFFTSRREAGGTGLGLSVSARIVKEHGGELHFDSHPGQGTTVTLTLPVEKGDHAV